VSDTGPEAASLVDAYLRASSVPLVGGHASGTLHDAQELLATHPALPTASLFAAAVSGNAMLVRDLLAHQPSLVSERGGPHQWDALTWCCFSRWLRDDRARADAFVATARVHDLVLVTRDKLILDYATAGHVKVAPI
jgi:hypothetical protein